MVALTGTKLILNETEPSATWTDRPSRARNVRSDWIFTTEGTVAPNNGRPVVNSENCGARFKGVG